METKATGAGAHVSSVASKYYILHCTWLATSELAAERKPKYRLSSKVKNRLFH